MKHEGAMRWSLQASGFSRKQGFPCVVSLCLSLFLFSSFVLAQVPTNEFLFQEDSPKQQDSQEIERDTIRQTDKLVENEVDFQAPTVEFLQEKNVMKGSGGVLLSGDGMQAQADEGTFSLDSKDASLQGDVVLTGPDGTVRADAIDMNLNTETGVFSSAEFTLEEGAYDVSADRANKISETEY